jgi:hypothetical protein
MSNCVTFDDASSSYLQRSCPIDHVDRGLVMQVGEDPDRSVKSLAIEFHERIEKPAHVGTYLMSAAHAAPTLDSHESPRRASSA